MRSFSAVAFLVVTATVFKLLLFVLELGKLALIGSDLGLQFVMVFCFVIMNDLLFAGMDRIEKDRLHFR